MTGLRNVERHGRSLRDIRAIMNSMKSLAYMEANKLGKMVPAQQAMTEQIESAAGDLLAFHPDILPSAAPLVHVSILIGTERGFCGNLNQQILDRQTARTDSANPDARILAVGRKLHAVIENAWPDPQQLSVLDGAGVAEEVPTVLEQIVAELDSLRDAHGPLAVTAIYHDGRGGSAVRELLPPFRGLASSDNAVGLPPLLNVAPARLLLELSDHYLFSALFGILYQSLLNESLHRVSHLGDAVRHLDKQLTDLVHRANSLRQEQITEEIEVLLLST